MALENEFTVEFNGGLDFEQIAAHGEGGDLCAVRRAQHCEDLREVLFYTRTGYAELRGDFAI